MKSVGRVVVEQEAGHAVLDRVGQPAHAPRHGDGAVALRAHLRQPARLVLRGHQAHVGAGEQQVLELVGEVQLHGDAARRTLGELGEHRLVARLAVAEEDVLRVEGEVARIAEDQVEPLLRDEPRGEREDGRLPAAEPRRALQRQPAALLPDEVVERSSGAG